MYPYFAWGFRTYTTWKSQYFGISIINCIGSILIYLILRFRLRYRRYSSRNFLLSIIFVYCSRHETGKILCPASAPVPAPCERGLTAPTGGARGRCGGGGCSIIPRLHRCYYLHTFQQSVYKQYSLDKRSTVSNNFLPSRDIIHDSSGRARLSWPVVVGVLFYNRCNSWFIHLPLRLRMLPPAHICPSQGDSVVSGGRRTDGRSCRTPPLRVDICCNCLLHIT